MKIKHSKYKNTGILFELLVRQATSDTLNGTDSAAIDLIKRFFVKSELGREYKLYESVVKSNVLTESKASTIVTTILETSQKLNRTSLRKQKYNLINEIKKHYDLNSFFGAKLKNYKELASIYTLIESYNNKEITDTDQIIDNKITLLEYLTKQLIKEENVKEDVLKEFATYDKDLRILTYRVLLEKFNNKHQDLSNDQKQVLKEYINSVDSAPALREFYNNKIVELKTILTTESKNITDRATQVKVSEIAKLLEILDKNSKINEDNLVDLLQYFQLVNEIQSANGEL
tara:strand:+ start:7446 stop:8309 length:864 start_codon:yes stop_codon:yes gene_type:complete